MFSGDCDDLMSLSGRIHTDIDLPTSNDTDKFQVTEPTKHSILVHL